MSRTILIENDKAYLDENSGDLIFYRDKKPVTGLIQTPNKLHEINIYNLKLILTDYCNFSCKYCFIEKSIDYMKHSRNMMPWSIAKAGIDLFCDLSFATDYTPKMINLYGGEPLLNKEILKKSVKYIRDIEKTNKINSKIEIVLDTNGSLIDEEIASFLVEHDIVTIVSVDGNRLIHNKVRTYKDGKGTFDDVISGYEKIKNKNGKVVVSCVLSPYNSDNIEYIITYFRYYLNATSVGLNMLHPIHGVNKLPFADSNAKLFQTYKKAYLTAKEKGVYIEHIMRRIRPIVEGRIRYKDCPSYGWRIVIDPSGRISPCEAFFSCGKYTINDVKKYSKAKFKSLFTQWARRYPFELPSCNDCCSNTICGGGCAYNAYVLYGSIMKVDKRTCFVCQELLKWIIKEIYDKLKIKDKLSNKNYYIPTPDEKTFLYGKIPMDNINLSPLYHYSAFCEVK